MSKQLTLFEINVAKRRIKHRVFGPFKEVDIQYVLVTYAGEELAMYEFVGYTQRQSHDDDERFAHEHGCAVASNRCSSEYATCTESDAA